MSFYHLLSLFHIYNIFAAALAGKTQSDRCLTDAATAITALAGCERLKKNEIGWRHLRRLTTASAPIRPIAASTAAKPGVGFGVAVGVLDGVPRVRLFGGTYPFGG